MMDVRHKSYALHRWILLGLMAGATFGVSRLYSMEVEPAAGEDDAYESIAMFTHALEQIRENYVDRDKVTYERLIEGALRGMMESLDEYSEFMDADMYDDMQEDTRGQFGGLGIVISMKDGALTIVSPMEDTPGFRAGLQSEDRIIGIDGAPTEGVDISGAVKLLRGEPGTTVELKILRPASQEVLTFTIERADIKVPSVKDTELMDAGIGYIRITQFNEPTADSLQRELEKLEGEGMKALVLDLRNNPGGLLRSAIEVGQKFLKRREVIVYTQGRAESDQQIFRASGRDRYEDIPMAVLVNSGSASASEIVAGALQDHKRAILVGEKTFGKGSVQSILQLQEGNALRLTTAKYYTPAGRMINEKGIEPDIVVPLSPETWHQLRIQRARKENPLAYEEEVLDEAVRDVQLERAVMVLKGIMTFQARNLR